MDGAGLTRLHWRLRGAWMWPLLIALTLLDGVIAHWLTPFGPHTWSLHFGWVVAFILNLLAVVAGMPTLGWAVRRVRRDMPKVVARDYAGAGICLLITLWWLASGMANRQTISAYNFALQDATARAEAYIGDHAPAVFMPRLHYLDTYVLQAPEIYRTCVATVLGNRDYCVVVDRSKPFAQSVKYAGAEPNSLLGDGPG